MRLPTKAPFHLEATVRLLQRRPANRIDVWERGVYLRVLPAGGIPTLCRISNQGTIDEPQLNLELEPRPARAEVAQLARTLRRMLGLDLDPSFGFPGAAIPRLRSLANSLRGARPPRFPNLFETLGRIIPYQQLSLDSGTAITGRLVERFGKRVETAEGSVWSFPEPSDVGKAALSEFKGIGLNRRKVASLRRLAQLVSSGQLSEEEIERLPTDAALRRLEDLPGIGPWTATVVLLRGFGRMEVFPPGDAGVLRGLRGILGTRASVPSVVERAGNRRGYLYFYSLGARLLREGLIRPATSM